MRPLSSAAVSVSRSSSHASAYTRTVSTWLEVLVGFGADLREDGMHLGAAVGQLQRHGDGGADTGRLCRGEVLACGGVRSRSQANREGDRALSRRLV